MHTIARFLLVCGLVAGTSLSATVALAQGPRALLTRYCVGCHAGPNPAGQLGLDTIDLDVPTRSAASWERVLRRLRAGTMPPAGHPRPAPEVADAFVAAIETALDTAVPRQGVVPSVPLRRLNRTEYQHAIRDLLDLDVDAGSLLPADGSSYGFDTSPGALRLSPLLLEAYVTAARRISAAALGLPGRPEVITISPPPDLSQDQPLPDMPMGTIGGVRVSLHAPVAATYVFKAQLWETNAGGARGLEGQERPFDFELSVDGRVIHRAPVGGRDDDALAYASAGAASTAVHGRLQVRAEVAAGPHTVLFAFVGRTRASSQEVLQPLRRTSLNPFDGYGAPRLQRVTIEGPFDPGRAGETPSRRRILTCQSVRPGEARTCASAILSALARRAFRRDVTGPEVAMLLTFFDAEAERGFEAGIAAALTRILSGPEFLFRAEGTAGGRGSGTRADGATLASRLSFFLWSSLPDQALLDAGLSGRLREPGVLDGEVARLLADSRATLATDFAGQWLQLRDLSGSHPDLLANPDWDDNLRQSMRRETELLFQSVVQENRSVLDLLTADYTFVNERLARHYGWRGIYGPAFRRVPVRDEARRGLLGHGSILTITSLPTRTSPVLRGKWILSQLLNAPPPPPPPGVSNALSAALEGGGSIRERSEAHRRNPQCAGCHQLMEPLGLALEHFDATGRWRTTDEGVSIDASGSLPSGQIVDGASGVRQSLTRRPELFVRALIERLMTYALGRGIGEADQVAVRAIERAASKEGYRFSALIRGIVQSAAFQAPAEETP